MRHIVTIAIWTLLSLAACREASANDFGFVDGNALYADCTDGSDAKTVICTAYIFGAIDSAMAFDGLISPAGKTRFCFPADVNGEQVKDIVINYLRDNPVRRSERAADSVAIALLTAFPCSK